MKAAFIVLKVGVAGQIPASVDIGFLPHVGQIATSGRPAYRKPADSSRLHDIQMLVHDLRLIPFYWTPCNAWVGVIEAIGNEDVQQLGGADAVENRFAGLAPPILEDRRRQCLAGRD